MVWSGVEWSGVEWSGVGTANVPQHVSGITLVDLLGFAYIKGP